MEKLRFTLSIILFSIIANGQVASILVAGDTLSNGASVSLCEDVFIPFDVIPTGISGSLTYQWTAQSAVPANVGVKSPQIKFTSTGLKQVTVTVYGSDTVTTTIQVNVLPEVVAPVINSAQTICHNTIPQVLSRTNASGSDGNFSYEWQYSINGSSNWQNTSIGTTIYQPAALGANRWFRVKTNSLCGSVFSNVIMVTVQPALNPGGINLNNLGICPGQTKSLYVSGYSGGNGTFSFLWQEKSPDSTQWQTATNTSNSAYFNAGPTAVTREYRAQVTSCGNSAYTNKVTLTPYVVTIDSIVNLGADSVCSGGTYGPLKVYASSPNSFSISYQWFKSTNNGNSWTNMFSYSSQLFISSQWTTTMYKVEAYTSGCYTNKVESQPIKIYTINQPYAPTLSSSQNICMGETPADITRSNPFTFNIDYKHEWETAPSSTGPWTATGDSDLVFQPGPLTSSLWYRVRTEPSFCVDTLYSQIGSINVQPQLAIGVLTPDTSVVCQGSSVTLNMNPPTGSVSPYTVNWQYKPAGALTWALLPGSPQYTYTFNNIQQSFDFRVIVTSGCNERDTTNMASIIVSQNLTAGQINIPPGFTGVCPGQPAPMLTLSGYSGGLGAFNFVWQKRFSTGTWFLVGNNNDTLVDTSPITQTTYYKVVLLDASGCSQAETDSVEIVFGGEPGDANTGIIGANSVCSSAKGVYYRLQPTYSGSVTWRLPNGVISGNGRDRVFVDFNSVPNTTIDTLIATLYGTDTLCKRIIKYPINISTNTPPTAGSVQQIGQSQKLVHIDSIAGNTYEWGYFERQSGFKHIVQVGARANCVYPNSIDTTAHLYYATISNNACKTTAFLNGAVNPFGVEKFATNSKIVVYPNPNQGVVYLKGALEKIERIRLSTLSGELMEVHYNTNTSSIDLPEGLPNGLYILITELNDGQQVDRINLIRN